MFQTSSKNFGGERTLAHAVSYFMDIQVLMALVIKNSHVSKLL